MNTGNSPASRLKASITRSVHRGMAQPKSKPKVARVPHEGDEDRPRLKAYRGIKKFMGSFKFGGPVKRTGIYLLHAGEHVKSPFNRRRG